MPWPNIILRRVPLAVFGRIGIVSLLFLGLTAPVWMSFLGALNGAYTAHMDIKVKQLPVSLLLGVFDDFFYQILRQNIDSILAVVPGTSLLVFVGGCFSICRWRQLQSDLFFWVNSLAILFLGRLYFPGGAVLIAGHGSTVEPRRSSLDTDFSYVFVIHLTIQAAYGFSALARADGFRRLTADLLFITIALAVLLALYSSGPVIYQPVPWTYFLGAIAGAVGAPLHCSFT